MEQDEKNTLIQNSEIKDSLIQIKQYLETDINNLTKQLNGKDSEIKTLKEELENVQHLMEGNRQLINKFLGDLSKLQNDIDWYKKTYEKRSFLGVIREKILRK
jgi:chromosome segregation ATPase